MADSKTEINNEFYNSFYNNIQNNERGFISVYDSVENEYHILKYGVGVRDASSLSIIEMRGKDTLDFLNRISTNSVKDLKPYKTVTTIFTNEKGRIIDRVSVINNDNLVLLICHKLLKEKLYYWLNKYIIMEDIKTSDESANYFIYDFYGQQVNSFMKMLLEDLADGMLLNQVFRIHLENREFLFLLMEDFNQTFYRLVGASKDKEFLFNYLNQNKSVFDLGMIGETAFDIFRIEHGIPAVPNEINELINPYESNIISDVSFTKGCYIGQEVIARLDTYDKVQKKLKGVVFSENYELQTPAIVINNEGVETGMITSVTHSLQLKKQIGLAILKKGWNESGNKLSLKDKNSISLTVSDLPFVK